MVDEFLARVFNRDILSYQSIPYLPRIYTRIEKEML